MDRGDANRAISLCEKTVELAPGDSHALAILANVLMDSGRIKEGVKKMQQAIRLSPFPPPWFLMVLGIGLHLNGDNEAAFLALEQSAKHTPGSNIPLLWLASTLVEMGRLDEARAFFREALDMEPSFNAVNWVNRFKSDSHKRLKANLLAVGLSE